MVSSGSATTKNVPMRNGPLVTSMDTACSCWGSSGTVCCNGPAYNKIAQS
jgi:hypothetical protein